MRLINRFVKASIQGAVGEDVRVYPAIGSEAAKAPYVIYRCGDGTPERSKDGIESVGMTYTVICLSERFDQADRMMDSVMALDGTRSGGKEIALEGFEGPEWDGSLFRAYVILKVDSLWPVRN